MKLCLGLVLLLCGGTLHLALQHLMSSGVPIHCGSSNMVESGSFRLVNMRTTCTSFICTTLHVFLPQLKMTCSC